MIACELSPSEGDVSVFGTSVSQNAYQVRRSIGFCRQDDYLYPNLSAKEHLELFAGLRGVADNEMAVKVQHWLESVDLAVVQDQYSSGYSGGMKRRLSVACSTIGDSPLVILVSDSQNKRATNGTLADEFSSHTLFDRTNQQRAWTRFLVGLCGVTLMKLRRAA